MEKVSNDDLVGYIVLAQNSDAKMGLDRYLLCLIWKKAYVLNLTLVYI